MPNQDAGTGDQIEGEIGATSGQAAIGEGITQIQIRIGQVLQTLAVPDSWEGVKPFASSRSIGRLARNRSRILVKVRDFWVKGVLDRSLYNAVLIDLGITSRPEAVAPIYPWGLRVQRPDSQDVVLPSDTTIASVFDTMDGQLLILGAPGSGKTIMLLELTRTLLDRAEQDEAHPLPIVFNLSSWARHRQPLAVWLVAELHAQYQVPKKVGQEWVNTNQITPLLDGLDEVAHEHRAACVAAINEFQRSYSPEYLVVCSRLEEYEDLQSQLLLRGAIVLQPLTPQQVDAYFTQAGPALASVHAALDHDATLREMVRTPLMLSIITLAYKNVSAPDLLRSNPTKDHWNHILGTYVQRMLERPETYRLYSVDARAVLPPQQKHPNRSFSAQLTIHWLGWLARMLLQQNETLFFVERLQPDVLHVSVRRRYYFLVALLVGLLVGVPIWLSGIENFGLSFGLGAGLGAALGGESRIAGTQRWSWKRRLTWGLILGVCWAVSLGVRLGLEQGPVLGLPRGVLFGLLAGLVGSAAFVITQRLSWRLRIGLGLGLSIGLSAGLGIGLGIGLFAGVLGGLMAGLGIGLLAGLGIGLIVGLVGGLSAELVSEIKIIETLRWSWKPFVAVGLLTGLGFGSLWAVVEQPSEGLLWGLRAALVFGLIAGISGRTVEVPSTAEHGIWRSAKSSLRGLLLGFVVWLILALLTDPTVALRVGLMVGLILALRSGLMTCLQHVLLRIFLYRNGVTPYNYVQFLDYAVERLFLRKVGGGYIFVHRLLLEYFAAQESNETRVVHGVSAQ